MVEVGHVNYMVKLYPLIREGGSIYQLISYILTSRRCLSFTFPYSNRTPEEVIAAKGVKPTLSPNLDTLALVEVHADFILV